MKVPHHFYNTTTGNLFEECLECNKYLLNGEPYVIEKAIRQYPPREVHDVVFEYALCMDCVQKMRSRMSVESTRRIESYFRDKAKLTIELPVVGSKISDPDVEQLIGRCIFEQIPRQEATEYQIIGFFTGDTVNMTMPPHMISGIAMDRIMDLLSQKTLDELDDFSGRHFGGPPEVSEILKRPRPVLI